MPIIEYGTVTGSLVQAMARRVDRMRSARLESLSVLMAGRDGPRVMAAPSEGERVVVKPLTSSERDELDAMARMRGALYAKREG